RLPRLRPRMAAQRAPDRAAVLPPPDALRRHPRPARRPRRRKTLAARLENHRLRDLDGARAAARRRPLRRGRTRRRRHGAPRRRTRHPAMRRRPPPRRGHLRTQAVRIRARSVPGVPARQTARRLHRLEPRGLGRRRAPPRSGPTRRSDHPMSVVPYSSPAPATASSYAGDWLLDPAEIANRIGGTDFVPQNLRDNPAAITAALLYGHEVGLGRMASLAMIAVINGRPTLSAEAQRALILAAGHEVWVEEAHANRRAPCGRRRGSDVISRVSWTIDDARRANLAGKQPWRMYPRQMVQAGASAEPPPSIFPDVIRGLRATEELEDEPEQAAIANGSAPEPPKSTR